MAIKVNFLSDVDNLVRGTERVAKSMEDIGTELRDVADEMDKTARAGDTMGDGMADGMDTAKRSADDLGDGIKRSLGDAEGAAGDLEQDMKGLGDAIDKTARDGKDVGEGIERGMKDADSSVERFEDQIRQAMRKASNSADDAGKKIGKSQKDGFDKAGEGVEEFKDEANSTARESAASFDGSAESIVDSFQEIAANAFAGFGPAGAAAGLAIAAGIGIAITKLQELAEGNTDAQQAVADLAGEFIELGGAVEKLDLGARINDWGLEVNEDNWMTFWADESETNFQRFKDAADEAGIGTKTAFQAMRGSYEDAQQFMKDTEQTQKDLSEAIQDGTTYTADGIPIMDDSARSAKRKRDATEELRGETVKNMQALEEAKEIEEIATEATQDNTAAIESKIDALNELAGNTLSAREADRKLIESEGELKTALEDNGKTIDINTDKGRKNQRAIDDRIDTINDWAQSQVDAGADVGKTTAKVDSMSDALVKQMTPFFGTKQAAREYIEQVLKTPKKVETDVKADTTNAEATINSYLNKDRGTTVDVDANTTSAQNRINRLDGQTITAYIFGKPVGGFDAIA